MISIASVMWYIGILIKMGVCRFEKTTSDLLCYSFISRNVWLPNVELRLLQDLFELVSGVLPYSGLDGVMPQNFLKSNPLRKSVSLQFTCPPGMNKTGTPCPIILYSILPFKVNINNGFICKYIS
jgi:hypothetical protein